MGKTPISWCHFTHNIWEGCSKISPGCKHCYAEAMNHWLRKGENWGFDAPRKFFAPGHYKKPLAWNEKAKRENTRFRVFVGSVMDIAEIHPNPEINARMDELRSDLYETIEATPYLDYLFLSKRPENYERILPWWRYGGGGRPYKNVWLGTSAENQEMADQRLPILAELDAAITFVSYEPALEDVDWTKHFAHARRPHWLIAGCESGRKARAAKIDWFRHARDACAAAGLIYHLKQAEHTPGDFIPVDALGRKCSATLAMGADIGSFAKGKGPSKDATIIELPYLDGVQHANFPAHGGV